MHRVLVAVALLLLGCHHDAGPAPIGQVGPPPLPPASGTPVGYLLDGAGDLHLTDDQVAQLKDIDNGLSARVDAIDGQLRALGKPPESAQNQGGGRGRRGMRMGGGGMGGGMNGGMGGGGSGGRTRGGGSGSGGANGSGSASPAHAAEIGRLTEERASEVRDALQRSFALLDAQQQTAAKKLLDDNGVDLDAGRPNGSKKAGDGERESDDDGDDSGGAKEGGDSRN